MYAPYYRQASATNVIGTAKEIRTLKNQQFTVLLAAILAAPVCAFADNIPGHSRAGNNFVSFSEGLGDQQDSHGSSARCNFLFSSVSTKANASTISSFGGASANGFAKGEMDSNLGALNAGMELGGNPEKGIELGPNQNASPGKDKGKAHGKNNGEDPGGNLGGTANGNPSPLASVAEPASQTLLFLGLAGLGVVFLRRRPLTNVISMRA